MLEHEQESRRELERRLLPPGSDVPQEAKPAPEQSQPQEVEVISATAVEVIPQADTDEEKKKGFQ